MSEIHNVQSQYINHSILELIEIQHRDRLPYSVGIMDANSDKAIERCINSAAVFGVTEVFIINHYKSIATDHLQNKYLALLHHINLVKGKYEDNNNHNYDNREIIISSLRDKSYYPVYVNNSNGAGFIHRMHKFDYYGDPTLQGLNPCFIICDENYAMPKEYTQGSMNVAIKRRGVINALDVASTCGIVCHKMAELLIA